MQANTIQLNKSAALTKTWGPHHSSSANSSHPPPPPKVLTHFTFGRFSNHATKKRKIMSTRKSWRLPQEKDQIHPSVPSKDLAKQSLPAPNAEGFHKMRWWMTPRLLLSSSSSHLPLLLLSSVAEVSMLLLRRPCCPLSNLLHRWHAISEERAHLEHHPLLLDVYRRLPNGHPGPFLMGVWSYVLMGTSDIEKDIPGGLFKTKHFQFLTGLKKSSEDEMKMVMVVIFCISKVSAFLKVPGAASFGSRFRLQSSR